MKENPYRPPREQGEKATQSPRVSYSPGWAEAIALIGLAGFFFDVTVHSAVEIGVPSMMVSIVATIVVIAKVLIR